MATNDTNNAAPERVTISSADEAWSLLQSVLEGKQLPKNMTLVFDNWPEYSVKVKGKDWHGTVPTRVMSPLLDIQRDLHRAYANVCYGSRSLHRLKDEERDLLELIVKVDEGSSDYKAPMWEQLNELGKKAFEKMESRDVVITILGIALVLGGVEVSKSWIASRQDAIQAEKTVDLSREETARLKVFAEAMKAKPMLADTRADFQESQGKMLRTIKSGDTFTSKGVELQGYQAQEIAKDARSRAVNTHLKGMFRVMANDASRGAGFRIKVVRVSDGLAFAADVPLELDIAQQRLIQKAEWSKGAVTVFLDIEASLIRDTVANAVVREASDPS